MSYVSPITMSQGETVVETIQVTDVAGAAVSITGCFLYLIVRELDGTLVPALCRSTAAGIVLATQSAPTLGQATATWAHEDLDGVEAGQYKYIVYIVDAIDVRQVVVDWSPLDVLAGEDTLPPLV